MLAHARLWDRDGGRVTAVLRALAPVVLDRIYYPVRSLSVGSDVESLVFFYFPTDRFSPCDAARRYIARRRRDNAAESIEMIGA